MPFSRSGTSHAGPHQHHDSRSHNPTVAYRCEGVVREVEPESFVLLVQSAHGRAKRWIGKNIQFSSNGAKLVDHTGLGLRELGHGDEVCVRTRLPRHLDMDDPLEAHRIDIEKMGGPDHRMLYAEATRSGASTVRA